MHLIFKYGPQSGWEKVVKGSHSFTNFALRAFAVGWGEEHAVVSKIDQMEKFRGLRSGFLADQASLLINEGIFL